MALNLASACHDSGSDVLLIDADLRHSDLSDLWGHRERPGLRYALAGGPIARAITGLEYAEGRQLPFIPAGADPGVPVVMARVDGMPSLVRLDDSWPVAVVDAPPLGTDPLTLRLADKRTGLLVVVSPATTVEDLRALKARAELAEVPILGFVTNDHVPKARAGPRRAIPHRRARRTRRRKASGSTTSSAADRGNQVMSAGDRQVDASTA